MKHKDIVLELYCSICQCVVCPICCHSDHQSHTFREITVVNKELKSELDEAMVDLQVLIKKVGEHTEQIIQAKIGLESSTSNARTTAESIFQKMQQMLDQKAKDTDNKICKINEHCAAKTDIENKNCVIC